MTAAKLKSPLIIEQGADFKKTFIWKAGDPPAPVDLTSFVARMHIRETIESTNILVTLTTENGGIVLGGTTGTIDLVIPATDTTAMTWKKGVFDLEMVGSTGLITRLIQGDATLSPEVTR